METEMANVLTAVAKAAAPNDRLDLLNGGIAAFLEELRDNEAEISGLVPAVRAVVRAQGLTTAVRNRIEAIVRFQTRVLLCERASADALEATVKAANACAELIRELDGEFAARLSAWSDLAGDVLYARDAMPIERVRRLAHMSNILKCLYEADGWLDRKDVMKIVGLKKANMSRVMNFALEAGIVLKKLNHRSNDSSICYLLSSSEREKMDEEATSNRRFAERVAADRDKGTKSVGVRSKPHLAVA
jgi:hypothetical protein